MSKADDEALRETPYLLRVPASARRLAGAPRRRARDSSTGGDVQGRQQLVCVRICGPQPVCL